MRRTIPKRTIRHRRIRTRLSGTAECPRLSVYRSLNGVQLQLIDDQHGRTIGSVSLPSLVKTKPSVTVPDEFKATKTAQAFQLGWLLAQQAKEQSIERVVFDRGGYQYHGRVRAAAEGARAGGLKF
ncbi:50S ribosomal protein L18 [Candidatus Uhrbacteria bacterium]|nr:50S ribosomal protein L18 [Candidatus Uhrbacteria bacterium]